MSVREWTSSFFKMCETWVATVRRDSSSRHYRQGLAHLPPRVRRNYQHCKNNLTVPARSLFRSGRRTGPVASSLLELGRPLWAGAGVLPAQHSDP